jgi:hypothetical protein
MAESEIINQYPIGTGLDAFREAFSSTCAGLNVHESLDAVQQLSDKGEILDLPEDAAKCTQFSKTSRSTCS